MNSTIAFLLDLALAGAFCIGIVIYVKPHLRTLLIELCGTTERANFWLVFSNVTLVLIPLIFALNYTPEFGPDKSVIFEMATQLKYALIGTAIALGSLALVLMRFIPRNKSLAPASPPQGTVAAD